MKAACQCGAVSIELAHKPEYVNFCDCSLCAKCGGAWGYFDIKEVSVSGPTRSYRRADMDPACIELHFCSTCGATTHWLLTEHSPGDRIGVNMRLFEPAELAGIEGRMLDGRNWTGAAPPDHHRPAGLIGKDIFI